MISLRHEATFQTLTHRETEEAGELLGNRLRGGEVIGLEGGLGVGKTTFVRGLGRGLRVPDAEVSSPTFVFMHEHIGRLTLIHIDLYRIQSPADLPDLGMEDLMVKSSVVVIEWAEHAAGVLPENHVRVHFTDPDGIRRQIHIQTSMLEGELLLSEVRNRFCQGKKR